MELKSGDKVKTIREITFVNGEILPKCSILTYECRVDYLNTSFLKDENGVTTVLKDGDFELVKEETIKLKMVIGENRVVECGEYDVKWECGTDYKVDRDYSVFSINDSEKRFIHQIVFRNNNYKQQMEIVNLILEKLGLNVELVEGCDSNSEVLEQIEKLEAELEKLRGMIK